MFAFLDVVLIMLLGATAVALALRPAPAADDSRPFFDEPPAEGSSRRLVAGRSAPVAYG